MRIYPEGLKLMETSPLNMFSDLTYYYGINCVPQNLNVEALASSTSECDQGIWR